MASIASDSVGSSDPHFPEELWVRSSVDRRRRGREEKPVLGLETSSIENFSIYPTHADI